MSSPNHSFDIYLAEKYGIPCAILIQHFQHWIRVNRKMKRNQHEGNTWCYQTRKDLAAHFPYWTTDKIRRYLDKLVNAEVLVKGNFNKLPGDNTQWYAFKNIDDWLPVEEGDPGRISPRGSGGMAQGSGQLAQALPDTKQDTKITLTSDICTEEEKPPPKKRAAPKRRPAKIQYDPESREFLNVTQQDYDRWAELFPGVDIARELKLCANWAVEQERKSWAGTISTWLGNAAKDLKKNEAGAMRNRPARSNSNPCLTEEARRQYDNAF